MNITVVGSGYVGLVAGACFSQMGNNVVALDINESKINKLNKGQIPIYEPGLENMIVEGLKNKTLIFSTDKEYSLSNADIIIIAVGTPMDDNGGANLEFIRDVSISIGQYITKEYIVVVSKSTVPVGTNREIAKIINKELKKRNTNNNIHFDIVSNPEFLKEGVAIKDFLSPDRIIIGTDSNKAYEVMKKLYAPFMIKNNRFIKMSIESAEMTKYAANAMLATKISFINEMSQICELVGANINDVRIGIGADSRIGYSFIYPGCGFGGSCFPKDVKALEKTAKDYGYNARILDAIQAVNKDQKQVLVKKIKTRFGDNLNGKTFAIWGLSFKPETDDMREATSIVVINELTNAGASIKAYDPKAMNEVKYHIANKLGSIKLENSKYECLSECDALVVLTEWREFRSPDFNKIYNLLRNAIIFDGRNIYHSLDLESMGFEYHQIGVATNII